MCCLYYIDKITCIDILHTWVRFINLQLIISSKQVKTSRKINQDYKLTGIQYIAFEWIYLSNILNVLFVSDENDILMNMNNWLFMAYLAFLCKCKTDPWMCSLYLLNGEKKQLRCIKMYATHNALKYFVFPEW